jgi:hypothetical protein
MKGIILALLGFLLLAAPAVVQAQAGCGDGYTYSLNGSNANSITITGYWRLGGAVTIPTNINGFAVTSIGSNAFALITIGRGYPVSTPTNLLTSVTIPGSVTNVGYGAFAECYELTNAALAYGVTSIGANAFYRCERLTGTSFH